MAQSRLCFKEHCMCVRREVYKIAYFKKIINTHCISKENTLSLVMT